MSKTAKIILWIIAVALIVWVIVAIGSNNSDKSPFKVGVILPLSGDLASLGEGAKNGGLLAYNELTQDQKDKFAIVFEDDKFDPKNTVSSFNKLVEVDKISAIICFASTPCASIASLADEKQMPLIAIASAPVQKDHNYVVRLELSTSEEGKVLSQYVNAKKYTNIASVIAVQEGVQSAYGSFILDEMIRQHVVINESVKSDEKDYKSVITKIIAKKPDVIVVGLLPGSAGLFTKQARELGYKGDFVGFNFVEGDETLEVAKGSIEGIVYTQASDPTVEFINKFQTAYGKSFGPGSAHLYDAIKLISNAVGENNINKDNLIGNLKSVKNYSGALGTFSSINDGEYNIPVSLKTVKGGKFASYP